MVNSGKEYEDLVAKIYNRLNRQEGFPNIRLQQNVKLKDKVGIEHQIDIYWEFQIAGVIYRMAVECKDHGRAVEMKDMEAFAHVLQEIGGISGIFVSKSGFQSGAVAVAKANGIQMLEIRKPNAADWEGKIKDIHIDIGVKSVANVRPMIVVDQEWCNEYLEGKVENIKQVQARTDAVYIDDIEAGEKKMVKDIINTLPVDRVAKDLRWKQSYRRAFFVSQDLKIKIDEIEILYDVQEDHEKIVIKGDEVVAAIVKNLQSGNVDVIRSGEL